MIGVEVTPVLEEILILYSPTKAKIPTKIIFPLFMLFFSHMQVPHYVIKNATSI